MSEDDMRQSLLAAIALWCDAPSARLVLYPNYSDIHISALRFLLEGFVAGSPPEVGAEYVRFREFVLSRHPNLRSSRWFGEEMVEQNGGSHLNAVADIAALAKEFGSK